MAALESLGAPKGSKVRLTNSQTELELGKAEGIAVGHSFAT
jgi:hypothetical protein